MRSGEKLRSKDALDCCHRPRARTSTGSIARAKTTNAPTRRPFSLFQRAARRTKSTPATPARQLRDLPSRTLRITIVSCSRRLTFAISSWSVAWAGSSRAVASHDVMEKNPSRPCSVIRARTRERRGGLRMAALNALVRTDPGIASKALASSLSVSTVRRSPRTTVVLPALALGAAGTASICPARSLRSVPSARLCSSTLVTCVRASRVIGPVRSAIVPCQSANREKPPATAATGASASEASGTVPNRTVRHRVVPTDSGSPPTMDAIPPIVMMEYGSAPSSAAIRPATRGWSRCRTTAAITASAGMICGSVWKRAVHRAPRGSTRAAFFRKVNSVNFAVRDGARGAVFEGKLGAGSKRSSCDCATRLS